MKFKELIAKTLCVITIILLLTSLYSLSFINPQNHISKTYQNEKHQKELTYIEKLTYKIDSCNFENEFIEELEELDKDLIFDIIENFDYYKRHSFILHSKRCFIDSKDKILYANVPKWLKNRQIIV